MLTCICPDMSIICICIQTYTFFSCNKLYYKWKPSIGVENTEGMDTIERP